MPESMSSFLTNMSSSLDSEDDSDAIVMYTTHRNIAILSFAMLECNYSYLEEPRYLILLTHTLYFKFHRLILIIGLM